MPTQNPSYIAGETLYVSRFVAQDASDDLTVNMAEADDRTVGIVHEGSRDAPIPEVSTVIAAAEGESVRVHGPGEECWVVAGAAVSPNDLLMPDADGKAIAATTGKWAGARALSAAAAEDERIRCVVVDNTLQS